MKNRKIIVACDSYKGCMSSREVNAAVAEALQTEAARRGADVSVVQLEMSDGGEGMLDAFLAAMGGERVGMMAHDALMRVVEVEYGLSGGTAVVEIAQAAGLARIEPEQRNPMRATSYGVGEMVMDAWRRGVRDFIVGLGGSATSDCGIGMLRAMGDDWHRVARECRFTLASDVTSPLYGPGGAARVFAPQKGADAVMVESLDARARRFADVCARHFGYDSSQEPGAGAAGGLGYAFMQFFNARQEAGAELLLDRIDFDDILRGADLVITGEGHSDSQTLMGKLPQRILGRASRAAVPVWLVSGGIDNATAMTAAGFARVMAVTPKCMPLAEAMKKDAARRNIASSLRDCFVE